MPSSSRPRRDAFAPGTWKDFGVRTWPVRIHRHGGDPSLVPLAWEGRLRMTPGVEQSNPYRQADPDCQEKNLAAVELYGRCPAPTRQSSIDSVPTNGIDCQVKNVSTVSRPPRWRNVIPPPSMRDNRKKRENMPKTCVRACRLIPNRLYTHARRIWGCATAPSS